MTHSAPPTMFPKVTGIKFFSSMSATVSLAPLNIPRGKMNMLATEWSSPSATKAEMGNHTAVILPAMVVHPDAMYTCRNNNNNNNNNNNPRSRTCQYE